MIADRIDLLENFWLFEGRERAVYFYFFVKGMSLREIGAKARISVERVRQLTLEIGRKIREIIYRQRCVIDGDTAAAIRAQVAKRAGEKAALVKAAIEEVRQYEEAAARRRRREATQRFIIETERAERERQRLRRKFSGKLNYFAPWNDGFGPDERTVWC